MTDTRPPLDYLATCSQPSLEAFELARLNRAANLRKELRDLLEEWIEAEGEARLARWLLEGRRARDFEIHVSPNEKEPLPLATTQMLLSMFPERDGNAKRFANSGAPLLNTNRQAPELGEESLTSAAILALPQSEMPERKTPKPANSLAPKPAGPAPAGLTDSSHVRQHASSPESRQPGAVADAGASKEIPMIPSSTKSADADKNGCARPCNLHPSISQLVASRDAGDHFGEADFAPAVELGAPKHSEFPHPGSCAPASAEAFVQFRIRFGRPMAAERDEMAEAS